MSNQVKRVIMKKLLIVMVFFMSVLALNAQYDKTPSSETKSKTTTTTKSTTAEPSNSQTVQAADLPKSITDNIAKDYPGYTVKEATSMNGKNGLTYQVAIMKGSNTETLLYDKDGKFLKKVGAKVSKSSMHHDMKKK